MSKARQTVVEPPPFDPREFDPDWLLEKARANGHRMPAFTPAPNRRSPDGYVADYISYCTRRGCTMGLAYWENPPDDKHDLYRAWVDRSATMGCNAARSRSLITSALRQERRQARRKLLADAAAAGHIMTNWKPFWLAWVKHTLCYESRCSRCGYHILTSLCAPHPYYANTYTEVGNGYSYDREIPRCPDAEQHQLSLF